MKPTTKLCLRKKALMALRALIWHADEWLHRQEVKLREDLGVRAPVSAVQTNAQRAGSTPVVRSTYEQWEARRSGIAVISKKESRKRRATNAATFDLRFSQR